MSSTLNIKASLITSYMATIFFLLKSITNIFQVLLSCYCLDDSFLWYKVNNKQSGALFEMF